MKEHLAQRPWVSWLTGIGLVACIAIALVRNTAAQDASPADQAWYQFQRERQPLPPPKEFYTKEPTEEQIQAFYTKQAAHATDAANLAKDFYTKYPQDARASEARVLEYRLLGAVLELGDDSVKERHNQLRQALVSSPDLPEEERMSMMLSAAVAIVNNAGRDADLPKVLLESAEAALKVADQFPKSTEPAGLLLELADLLSRTGNTDKAVQLFRRVANGEYPEQYRTMANYSLKPFEFVGKVLDVQFTAIDGRNVNLADLKGKVVLLDFWATWCGPCMAGLPELLETYKKLHPRGFEILGISADHDIESLRNVVDRYEIKWPQFYDEKNESNRIVEHFGITGFPTLWLVDKQGKLRDLNARSDLAAKVEKLLAE